ncbi:hypothetical protein ACWEQL_37670, partial [Kitasatospora sp. NPDC004240]
GSGPPGGARGPAAAGGPARTDRSDGAGPRARRRARPRGGPPPQPVALALVADAAAHLRLERYGLLGGAGYRAYLRRTETRLAAMRGLGIEIHLRVLEPADYEDYCEALGLDPGSAAARVAYAADPELAGEPFVYAGERLTELLPVLADDHRARVRMSIGCAALLDALGDGPEVPARIAELMRYVAGVHLALAEGAGPGRHLLTLRCHGPEHGERLGAVAGLTVGAGGEVLADGRDTEAFCVTLAAGVAARGEGALLLYGDAGGRGDPGLSSGPPPDLASAGAPGGPPDGSSEVVPGPPPGRPVRGWALEAGRLRPMALREVARALAADTGCGVPVPPDAAALPGFPLPGHPPAGSPSDDRGGPDGGTPLG